MEYKGSIELLSGLKPANDQDFPLLQAKDVLMPDGARLSDVTYYGYRYSDAYKVIDISNERDKSINMYLFENGDGFDAVVKGSGHMLNFCLEDDIYECLEDGIYTSMYNNEDGFSLIATSSLDILNTDLAQRYYPINGATAGKHYINPNDIDSLYKCKLDVPGTPVGSDIISNILLADESHFSRRTINYFYPGQQCRAGRLYRVKTPMWDRSKIYRLRIEADVKEIGDNFMCKAYNLRNLSFADSSNLMFIGYCAFAYTGIGGEYSFPNLDQDRIHQTFRQCPNLEKVSFNHRIQYLDDYSFEKCISLKEVRDLLPENYEHDSYLHLGDFVFKTCPNLNYIDMDPSMTYCGIGTFINCSPDEITCHYGDALLEFNLHYPVLYPEYNFNVVAWMTEDLTDPENASRVNLPVGTFTKVLKTPESDFQGNPEYYPWSGEYVLNMKPSSEYEQYIGKVPAYLSDQFYALFHVYNMLHPNTQYDNYMEFVTDKILGSSLVIDSELMAVLSGEVYARPDDVSEITENPGYLASNDLLDVLRHSCLKYDASTKYEIGEKISPADLPISLHNVDPYSASDAAIFRGEGTAWYETCHALGLYYQQCNLADEQGRVMIPVIDPVSGEEVIINRPAAAKELLLDSIKRGVPGVVIRDVLNTPEEMSQDQTYVVIGYNRDTDKFLMLESAWSYPSDIKPFTYWIKFEDLMLPTQWSSVITFNIRDKNEEMNNELIGLKALVSDANRNVLENSVAFKKCMDMMQQILDNMVTHSAQDLDESEKAQARENIGAVDENQVVTLIQENLPPNGDGVED